MTIQEIENGLSRIRNTSYSTGVIHMSAPAWLQDLRWCIQVIVFLLDEIKKLKPTERQHQWEFYANMTACKICGEPIGSGKPCKG